MLTAILLALPLASPPATLKGKLERLDIEGGVWILKQDKTTYDLHGKIEGFKAGDAVEVEGQADPGGVCVHMCGTIFKVEKIRAAKDP